MKVKVLKLGHSAREAEVDKGTTVREVLDKLDLDSGGYALSVNGLGAGGSTALSEGDIVTLTPKIEGGQPQACCPV